MEENFLADKPISEEKEDRFQRYNFSKRIAETILKRTSSDSTVIGLYGAWGEGKTSVLNFIKHELTPHRPDVIYFTFNPWRFTDEAALLTSFFNTLAMELKQSIEPDKPQDDNILKRIEKSNWWNKKKGPLKTNTETVGEIIQQYGKVVSIFGGGEAAEAIGKAISNVNIEELKGRIENLLAANKKRIVIFIDDIDRLEKEEIHAIFRLVKLTGDFAYTTYLLSFDEVMVASAIGGRFGTGDQKAGMNFLEKIIQIPIRLPLAQKPALKNYCITLIQQALDNNSIVLTDKEGQEFVRIFSSHFLNRLTTPRLAVRYGNALSFALPLLKGEVNYVDLLLIEGMRVFYPEIYDFIRNQPDYFIGNYAENSTYDTPKDEKISKFKKIFDEVTQSYSLDEIADVKEAITELFPNIYKVWRHGWSLSGTPEMRFQQKRISTTQYFNRYFSYTVLEGDISDVAFDELIENIKREDSTNQLDQTKQLIQSANPENFIQRIRHREKTFDSKTSVKLSKIMSQLGDVFPENENKTFVWFTSFSQAAIFIAQLIRNQIDDDKKYEIIDWIIENGKPFKFVYEIFNYCRSEKDEQIKLFTEAQYKSLAGKMIDRAKKLSGEKPIWEFFTYESKYMLNIWATEFDKQNLDKYVKYHLDTNLKTLIPLLKVFVGFIHSSAHPTPYFGDFEKSSYERLKKILDKNYIYEKAEELLGASLTPVSNYESVEHKQTDDNLIKQFAYWYNEEKK